MIPLDPSILENILSIRSQIPDSVILIAVTKQVPLDRIEHALEAGIQHIGENRVQEAQQKWEVLRPRALTWHLIGNLQKNKVGKAVRIFDWIHAVNSLKLAEVINKQAEQFQKRQNVLLQVKMVEDDNKIGFLPETLWRELPQLDRLDWLRIRGLMTIAPYQADRAMTQAVFGGLRRLSEEIAQAGFANIAMEHLSMGMSGDFEVALEEGSTMVRLGQKIFGSRA